MEDPESDKRPVRLLCDEMLQRLARWLRAAGYDTALAELGAPDRALIHRVVDEERLLITRDRAFLERRLAARHVFYLEAEALDDQAESLRRALGVDWLRAPFSRCLLCNTPLVPDAPERAPEGVTGEVWRCPRCDKLYWEGSHVRRMRARLACWSAR